MHATLPLLELTDFPAIRRRHSETLQVNLGYKYNQRCLHCHVNAGPNRKEMMDRQTLELILPVLKARKISVLDLTGGAPELRLFVEHHGQEKIIEFDALLCAVGRVARLEGYALEALGIETNRAIVTDEYLQTLYPNIFAAGDVAGPYQFTHTAAHQAWYAAVNALVGQFRKFKVDYRVIP